MSIVPCTRKEFESHEHAWLGPLGTCADESEGRACPAEEDLYRTCFQRDRDRILHCKAFRRLAHKTQVFLAPTGDHYRTRLIHTMEVQQIARDIARALRLNEDLTEAIALGHDLGHTPFGHAGEVALAMAMAQYRGISVVQGDTAKVFTHNEQSVRIVELLERGGRGLNLSKEVVDGIRCHTGRRHAKTAEGRVVAFSDRIAYINHDIDDALRAGLLTSQELPAGPCSRLGNSPTERISAMVRDLVLTSAKTGDICMSEQGTSDMMELRTFLFDKVYTKSDAKIEEPKAQRLVVGLFEYFIEHLDEVPCEYRFHAQNEPEVQVADFVSGMTDRYAIRVFEAKKIPRAWHA